MGYWKLLHRLWTINVIYMCSWCKRRYHSYLIARTIIYKPLLHREQPTLATLTNKKRANDICNFFNLFEIHILWPILDHVLIRNNLKFPLLSSSLISIDAKAMMVDCLQICNLPNLKLLHPGQIAFSMMCNSPSNSKLHFCKDLNKNASKQMIYGGLEKRPYY